MPARTLCTRQGQWNQKQISKVEVLSSRFYSLHTYDKHLLFLSVNTTFSNLTTASPCNNQNHPAMTIPYTPLSFCLDLSFLLILKPPFTPSWQSLLWWSIPLPSSVSLIFPISATCVCPWSSINSSDVPYLTLSEGSRGRVCVTVFKKSPVVYSNGLGLHIHSLLTDSPRAPSSPVSSVHGRYPILSWILYITVPFLGLDM